MLKRTCFFMVNHVNIFDPFFLYAAIPQFARGWDWNRTSEFLRTAG